MNKLDQFLHARRTEGRPTHLSLSPKGKFLICRNDLQEFWSLYNYHYMIERLCVAEMQTSLHIPVLVDVDIKVEDNNTYIGDPRLYNDTHVEALVRVYQKVLSEILQDIEPRHLIVFLFEKPPYRIEKNGTTYYKNGYHLQFPNIFMTRYQQEHILLPRIRLECKKLEKNEYPSCIPLETMIDKSYCRGQGHPWLLYGSRKDPSMDPYLLSKGFDDTGRVINEWWQLLMGFEYGTKVLSTKQEIDESLPQIFSIQVEGRSQYILEVRGNIHQVNWEKPLSSTPKLKKKTIQAFDEHDPVRKGNLVQELLKVLSPTRYEDRNEWIRIGWILYNTFDGNDDGYNYWVDFSRQSSAKFDEKTCHYEWSRMEKKDLTLATLKYIARLDNPVGYESVLKTYIQPFIDRCLKLDGAHNDLALILHQKYEQEFRCASIIHKLWYQFHGHSWHKIEEGYKLRQKISSEIVEDYEMVAKTYLEKQLAAEDEEEQKSFKKKMTTAMKMVSRLKTATYKTNVMKEAMEVFYEEEFLGKLDSNPYLIGFSNGVYDLKTFEFREGSPNDFLSLKMNIRYRTDIDHTSPEVRDVIDFFEKIFPDRDVREYFLNTSCDVFIGGNFNKIVQVWTGDGDNGKSITQSLFEQMLGPYSVKLPTSLIVGKRTQSSAACPELVRAGNGVRLAVLQEPDQKDVINIGILKELSGNDTFFARGLYREGSEITPMFKLVLICNELPNLHNSDRATWNRIRVVPFESVFSDTAPATFEEQLREKVFPKDPQFKDKIPLLIEPMAWFLLHRLQTKPKIVVEPEKVVLATEHYRKKNDVFRLFADEFIEDKKDKNLQLIEMYSTFKDWFRESFPNSPLPSKIEMKEYFAKKWGDPVGLQQSWFGHSIRTNFEV